MAKNKLEQVNQSYKKALGAVLLREFPDIVELSVSYVLIDPSYQHGRVWLKTTPEILTKVENKRHEIQTAMKRYVKTRYTPKLAFLIETGEVEKIDELFSKLDNKQ
ncbi:MAG: ribosome-binding factor A [Candidatus Berkelbacteria bacterium]|nr:MAG: ribosome-binding factor A [Candidatus Berkelbacteria bacterium]QQG52124.1 MAG: ribosome-binding factor A [Candidatus Berkelbacteria bacterium]